MIGAKMKTGIEIIKCQEYAERSEILFQITLNGASRFGIYVSDKNENAMSLFDATINDAYEIFDKVSEGKLSVIQLEEVIEDFSKEKIL